MNKPLLYVLVVLGILLSICPLYANGEPTAEMSGTGIIVPIDEEHADVLDQKITITLPSPRDVVWRNGLPDSWHEKPAVVRVEYVLQNESTKPLEIMVGWPTSGYRMKWKRDQPNRYLAEECTPAIKLDGKPVPFNLIGNEELVDQENQAIIKRGMPLIEMFLATKPDLKKKVNAILKEAKSSKTRNWLYGIGADKLKSWMVQKKMLPANQRWTRGVALGLLGYTRHPYSWENNNPNAEFIQSALHWIDPGYQHEYLRGKVSDRWSFQEVMLDPNTGRLVYLYGTLGIGPGFGVFRFPITLQPKKEHKLVIQYGQYLGWEGRPHDWYGMVYLMTPAKRWGGWEKTTIEVRVPSEWARVAIRPPMKKVYRSYGRDTYRVSFSGRPCEDLFISVVPPRR